MKKSFLLLVFMASTLMAAAMNGPLNAFDPQKLAVDKETAKTAPERNCIVCASCGNAIVCFSAGSCSAANSGLQSVLVSLGCPGS